jgi:WD40 repeat protein
VKIWNVVSGQVVTELFQGEWPIVSVGFSLNGRHVVLGSMGGPMRVIKRRTSKTATRQIEGHDYSDGDSDDSSEYDGEYDISDQECIYSVEFSPDGTRIASGSSSGAVQIWDTRTRKQLFACSNYDVAHKFLIQSAGFSPNGQYVVSGSSDGTLCVWDAQTGYRTLGTLTGHTDSVQGVQFSPDGLHLVSCSCDSTIRFWDVSAYLASPQPHVDIDTGMSLGFSCLKTAI